MGPVLREREVAERLGLGELSGPQLRRRLRRLGVPMVVAGRVRYVREEDFERWERARTVRPGRREYRDALRSVML